METTYGNKDDTAGLKVKVQFQKEGPDPKGLARWDAFEKRFLVVEVLLGSVLAGSREDALSKAKATWPDVKKISVSPSAD
ncbi:hypothetical protein NAC44_12025 [Allorhizobium sp. BGMRC 0089]|uniref:hypothetical protein n=1 Tax=Allorhizobium sonneratiae TaxID=2934936 RepID=UPI0020335DFC|nr:hypothetical protein [Allorhizobium sonneratiae]MCM2293050.1 hypothetical protein [Allorhizobium sonneratiae]